MRKFHKIHVLVKDIRMKQVLALLFILAYIISCPLAAQAQAQDSIPITNYSEPKEYEIGGIKVTGAEYSDDNAIIAIAGFKIGDQLRIPGPETPRDAFPKRPQWWWGAVFYSI